MTATEQRTQALTDANVVRGHGASIKRALTDGSMSLSFALHSPHAGSLRVFALLMALPGIGEHRARAVLMSHYIGEGRRVSALTDRQRVLLASDGRLTR